MSSKRVSLAKLLHNLEESFNDPCVSEVDRKLFCDQLYGTLDAASSPSTYVNGHSISTLVHAIRHALQSVAESTTDARVSGWWNPITASMLSCIETTFVSSEEDVISSRLSNELRISSHNPPLGVASKSNPTITKVAKPSQKKKDTNPVPLVTAQQPPVIAALKLTDAQVVTIRMQDNGPWFKNLSHVKCSKVQCAFCENLWHSIALTRCCDIKCHKKGVVCNSFGWSAHVFPTVWLAAKKDHDAGLPFTSLDKYQAKVERPPIIQEDVKEIERSSSPTYASLVRKRDLDLDCDEILEIKSPRLENLDWND